MSGGEQSLLALLRGLPPDIEPVVACPPGPLGDAVEGLGVERLSLTGTDGSLKLHPRRTPAALWAIASAAVQVRRHARRRASEVVHANSIRAAVIAGLARGLGGPPVVAHVRDCLPDAAVAHATQRLVARTASVVVANSDYTAAHFARAARPRACVVAHSPVELERFDPERLSRGAARAALGVAGDAPVLGVVAQITPWKGQEVAVRALALLRDLGVHGRLVIAGSTKFTAEATRFDNRAYLEGLHSLVADLGLDGSVRFVGERDDVPQVLAAIDLLLLPSWEEPFGRAIVEALAMGVPVLATEIGGPREVVRDGVEGRLLDPRDPAPWAGAAAELLGDRAQLAAMGERARERARAFGVDAHVESIRQAYEMALDGV